MNWIPPEDLRSLWSAVADYLNTQVPGQGDSLVLPVLDVVGLTVAGWYRQTLTRHRPGGR